MSTKPLILSSSGLKNIVPNINNVENEFLLVFGKEKVRMNKINAEFISPLISRLHLSDPTINTFNFGSSAIMNELFNENFLNKFESLSQGESIEVDIEESKKFNAISIFLGNEELQRKVRELFQLDNDEFDFNEIICQYSKNESSGLNGLEMINQIASNFYKLQDDEIEILSKFQLDFLHSILCSENLKLKDEDSLFDFIEKVFASNKNEGNLSINDFYEEVEIKNLSKNKFKEFIEKVDFNCITGNLAQKMKQVLFLNFEENSINRLKSSRYSESSFNQKSYQLVEYKNESGAFQGIIALLTKKCGGNVNDNNEVKVTSSSIWNKHHLAKYAVDLEDTKSYFASKNWSNSWIKYDFGERKVRPTYYSIRTRHDAGQGGCHPQNWVVEGSNTDQDDDWKELDSRENVTVLDDSVRICTFQITEDRKLNEFFRYLRIRQTGKNTGHDYYFNISALEYFGEIL